jgi:uncharacterized protein (DUF488 family)
MTTSPGKGEGADPIQLYTIGFTQKTAREFFTLLLEAGVRRVVDVRLNNVSQLAGFTKRADLEYFLRAIGGISYVHLPELAPTQEIMDAVKKHRGDWAVYEERFLALMAERRIEEQVTPATLDGGCLLCSEPTPEHCHRRLVAEYLGAKWGNITVQHL